MDYSEQRYRAQVALRVHMDHKLVMLVYQLQEAYGWNRDTFVLKTKKSGTVSEGADGRNVGGVQAIALPGAAGGRAAHGDIPGPAAGEANADRMHNNADAPAPRRGGMNNESGHGRKKKKAPKTNFRNQR